MELKYSELKSALEITYNILKDDEEIVKKYPGAIAHLKALSQFGTVPTGVIKYKVFDSSKEFEDFQNEYVVAIVNITPIYKDFKGTENNQNINIEVKEPSIMVTYYALEIKDENKG